MADLKTRVCEVLAKFQPPNSWPDGLVNELLNLIDAEVLSKATFGSANENQIILGMVKKLAEDIELRHPKTPSPKIIKPKFKPPPKMPPFPPMEISGKGS